MAKAKNKNATKKLLPNKTKEPEQRITMQALDELSGSSEDDEQQQLPVSQWSSKAKSLRQDIEGGKFDQLLTALKKAKEDGKDDEFEEDTLDSSNEGDDDDGEEVEEEEEDEDEDVVDGEQQQEESGSEEEEDVGEDEVEYEEAEDDEEEREGADKIKEIFEGKASRDSDDDDDSEDEDEDDETSEKALRLIKNNRVNSKALAVVTTELVASHAHLPWAETLQVVPATPLPFGEKPDPESGTSPLDIHDDLKREVAFYNCALEAVHEARARCTKAGVPFSRPDDFFAEMIKTDDHMAKIKDRLIFETKKMDAVAQRKANREQKLRGKESQANKVAEKAKRKRDHFQEVEEWANSAARNRGGALRDDADEMYLNKGPNKKRAAADRKYGFGGKKGLFKQNDRASMNDVSGYNPRGNFPGGMKKTSKGSVGGGGARPGKRARDSKRARR